MAARAIACTALSTTLTLLLPTAARQSGAAAPPDRLASTSEFAPFRVPAMWEYSRPLIAPERRDRDPSRAQKDPSVVFHGGKWHVFMTVKLPGRSAIEYCSFDQWENADRSRARFSRSATATTTAPRRSSTSFRTGSGT